MRSWAPRMLPWVKTGGRLNFPRFAAEASSVALPHPECLPVSSICSLNSSLLLLMRCLISLPLSVTEDNTLIKVSCGLVSLCLLLSLLLVLAGASRKTRGRASVQRAGSSQKGPPLSELQFALTKPCALSAALGRWRLWRRCCTPPDRSCLIAIRIAPT